MPFTDLLAIPNKALVKGVSTDYKNNCGEDFKRTIPNFTPIKQENAKRQDFKIINLIYQYNEFPDRDRELETFQFEKFKEVRDSILFFNLDDVESMNGKHLDSLKLKNKMMCTLCRIKIMK